jgi:hypothetical protein
MKRMVAGKRGHYVTKLRCEQNIWTAAALNCKLHIANWVPGQEGAYRRNKLQIFMIGVRHWVGSASDMGALC